MNSHNDIHRQKVFYKENGLLPYDARIGLLHEVPNYELLQELKRRIQAGEIKIDTEESDTIYEGTVDMISSVSWKEGLKEDWNRLDFFDLLTEQEKKEEIRKKEEFQKDNSRERDWKNLESLVEFRINKKSSPNSLEIWCKECKKQAGHEFRYRNKLEELTDIKNFIRLSDLEEIVYQKHKHGLGIFDRYEEYKKSGELLSAEEMLAKNRENQKEVSHE